MPRHAIAESPLLQSKADESGAHTAVHGVDLVMQARTHPLPHKDAIPSVPAGFVTPSAEERRRALRPLDEELVAETRIALNDIAAIPAAALSADLGPVAKDIGDPAATARELRDTDEALLKAERFVEYLRVRRAIAGSDAVKTLEAVTEEVQHRAKRDPQIADRFASTLRVIEARNAKIAEGMAVAKAAKKPA